MISERAFPSNGQYVEPSPKPLNGAAGGGGAAGKMPAEPSANGLNGRDAHGRFAKGNAGGPGNPFARQVGRLRQVLLNAATPERIERLACKMMELAEAGDVQAAKLVLSYVLGKPAEAVNPDTLAVEEVEQLKRNTAAVGSALPAVGAVELDPVLILVRAGRDAVTRDFATRMGHLLVDPGLTLDSIRTTSLCALGDLDAEVAALGSASGRQQRDNGKSGKAPSTNGTIAGPNGNASVERQIENLPAREKA